MNERQCGLRQCRAVATRYPSTMRLPCSRRGSRLTAALLTMVGAAGCGGESVNPVGAEPMTVVGRVQDTDVAIAVVSDAEGSVAYLCGGPETLQPWTRWLAGDGGVLEDTDGEGWRVEVDDDGAGGWVRPPGEGALPWQATEATGDAGLYSTVDEGCRTGVVVDAAYGAQGVWCSKQQGGKQGYVEQVTPVTPISKAGFLVEVALSSGVRELTVHPFGAAEMTAQR
jgi:hypothetical protein